MNLTVWSVRKLYILEPGEETDGHEALFCEGDCQGWIHRVCADIEINESEVLTILSSLIGWQ